MIISNVLKIFYNSEMGTLFVLSVWKEALLKTYRQFPIKLKLALDHIDFSDKEVFEKVDV